MKRKQTAVVGQRECLAFHVAYGVSKWSLVKMKLSVRTAIVLQIGDSRGGEPLHFVRKYISLVEPENSLSFHRLLSQMIPILTFTIFSREGELKLAFPN
jgi:hypothetical protein